MAEISLSKRAESVAGSAAVGPARGNEDVGSLKRSRGGNTMIDPDRFAKSSPDDAGTVNTTSTNGGTSGRKGPFPGPKLGGFCGGESGESAASESQCGIESEEAHPWDAAVGDDSPRDRRTDAWGRQRAGGGVGRQDKVQHEEEEDRLLEAGGLLGKRIQQTLSDVLDYDCSVGVAGNKVKGDCAWPCCCVHLLLHYHGACSWKK